MKTYSTLPLDAIVAVTKQKFNELVSIRPLDSFVEGDRGKQGQTERSEVLLGELHALAQRVRSELAAAIRREEASLIALSPSHGEFLTSTLLPNINKIAKAYFHGSLLAELFDDESDFLEASKTIKNAIWFTAEYTNIVMEEDDERRIDIDITFDILDQPWFQPDLWSANLGSLRPVIVGVEAKKIPVRIRTRMEEVHRAFTFGAWMATIALCRSVSEFSLIDRASNFGYKCTSLNRDGVEQYLSLDKLIAEASSLLPEANTDLELLRESGNRILHPKKKRNVIPLPKVLRSEALACVQAITRVVEILYRRSPRHDA